MNIEDSLSYVRKYFPTCDWNNHDYCWKKAFISSFMSNLAYAHISDYELERTENVNLIPSSEYMESHSYYIKNHIRRNVQDILREGQMDAQVFQIETEFAVALVIRINDVVFVALRGTEFFNISDWSINLNSLKSSPPNHTSLSNVKLHKGFYRAVLSFKDELEKQIVKRFREDSLIYITGHSLGGALAAILFGLWRNDYWHQRHEIINNGAHSTYTFGMPRYGNLEAIAFYPNPYHIINAKDIVPNLPPKILGYENCTNQILLDRSLRYSKKYKGKLRYIKKGLSLAIFKKTEHHSIETYVYHCFNKTKNS